MIGIPDCVTVFFRSRPGSSDRSEYLKINKIERHLRCGAAQVRDWHTEGCQAFSIHRYYIVIGPEAKVAFDSIEVRTNSWFKIRVY